MTRAQMFYIVALLTAVAIALIPLTLIVASRHSARSEPMLYIIPYKVPADHLHDGVFRPRRGMRFAWWKTEVPGMTGLPMVV